MADDINFQESAYDDDNDQQPLAGQAAKDKKELDAAVEFGTIGAQELGGKVQNVYDEETAAQSDQHQMPAPPSYCENLFNWFPLRFFCFIGGVALIVASILDFAFNRDAFIQWILRLYLLLFGIVIMMIESPTWACTRWFQLRTHFWFRILSRMWGRAWFYLFVTILCFGEFDKENKGEWTIVAGFYLIIISILSFIFSRLAANKLNRIYVFVAAGAEGDQLEARFIRKFDELAAVTTGGKIGSTEIVKLAKDAGRGLSNAERHCIQTYLDESCNGHVTKEDFMKQCLRLNQNRQRFL